jgi:hypothetical protein
MHKQPTDVQEPKPPLFQQVKSLPRFTWFYLVSPKESLVT